MLDSQGFAMIDSGMLGKMPPNGAAGWLRHIQKLLQVPQTPLTDLGTRPDQMISGACSHKSCYSRIPQRLQQ